MSLKRRFQTGENISKTGEDAEKGSFCEKRNPDDARS